MEASWPHELEVFAVGLVMMVLCIVKSRSIGSKPDVHRPLGGKRQRWVQASIETRSRPYNVVMLGLGTRGDIQPLIALALELELQGEFKALICAPEEFEDLVQSFDVAFASCGVHAIEQPEIIFESAASSFSDVLGVLNTVYFDAGKAMYEACKGKDVIVSTALSRSIALHVAEKLQLPCVCAHFVASDEPTIQFPPVEYGVYGPTWVVRSKLFRPIWNKLLYTIRGLSIVKGAVRSGLADSDKALRAYIGLNPANPLVTMKDVASQPSLHAYSAVVVPRPPDWPSHVAVTGYWRMLQRSPSVHNKEDQELDNFLDTAAQRGKKVLFVGFGSMKDDRGLVSLICKVVINSSELCAIISSSEDVPKHESLFVCRFNVQHDQVFPRCSCIIHHGGAGTTAAAYYAGTPSVVIPILQWSDQMFWASRTTTLGCGVALDRETASASPKAVQSSIEACFTKKCVTAAKAVASALQNEPSGTATAAHLLATYLDHISYNGL